MMDGKLISLSTIDKIKLQLPALYKRLGINATLQKFTTIKSVRFKEPNGFVGRRIQIHILPYVDGYVVSFSMAGKLERIRRRINYVR